MTYNNIWLEFEAGKIVKATANNTEKINEVLDTDQGARYIEQSLKDTLFDEELIRKDGSFVKQELKALNPENLK